MPSIGSCNLQDGRFDRQNGNAVDERQGSLLRWIIAVLKFLDNDFASEDFTTLPLEIPPMLCPGFSCNGLCIWSGCAVETRYRRFDVDSRNEHVQSSRSAAAADLLFFSAAAI